MCGGGLEHSGPRYSLSGFQPPSLSLIVLLESVRFNDMKTFLSLVMAISVSAMAQDALAPLPPDGFVTLPQIVQDFSSQPDAALQKYNGMRIVVYGRVGQVTQSDDEDGDPVVVYLQLPNNPTPDVKCVFNSAGVPQGGDVNVENNDSEADFYKRNRKGDITAERPIEVTGEMVAIRGTFDNFVAGDIVLKECRKLRPEALTKLLSAHGIPVE
jgi:hypothetical protein